jgi:hypothetical protein
MKNGQDHESRSAQRRRPQCPTHEGGEEGFTPRRRKTKADYRAEIAPATPPPTPFIQREVDAAVAAGAAGLRASQRVALNAAKRYMAELEDFWRRDTAFIARKASDPSDCSRACARYARRWRPRFLAMLSVTNSPTLAARAARVHRDTAFEHRKQDPEFAKFWADACERAVDLLEARAFQRAVEGDLEPVYYMGVVVDYVRKFDSRLQIELLRAKRPGTFKTPGVNVNVGVKSDVFVLTEEQRHELMRINREWLLTSPLPNGEPYKPAESPAATNDNTAALDNPAALPQ